MRRVYVDLNIRLIIDANDDAQISDIVNELEYSFEDTTGTGSVYDYTIEHYSVRDSK